MGGLFTSFSVAEERLLTSLQRWIFAESVRRTIIMAYSVITLYELLKGSRSDGIGLDFFYTNLDTLLT